MKKNSFIILLLAFVAFFLKSCDIVEPPYVEQTGQCGYDNLSVPIKKILVEDYTGFKCGNCPEAHELLAQLKAVYCDHLVPVSIHVGYFATPSAVPPYTTDFRTEAGNEYNNYFGADAAGLPVGMINRTEFNGSRLLSPDAWAAAIAQQLQQPPAVDVQITNFYDTAQRQVTSRVEIAFLQDISGNFYLNVWLTEDSIIDYQKDYRYDPPDIAGYVHRHVLRKAINGAWGESIFNGQATQGQTVQKTYTFTVDTAYNEHHCHVVAFVYLYDSKTVLQADDEKVIMSSKQK